MLIVVDYGMGNLHSVSKALETVSADVLVSSNPLDLQKAERIVLPGVGAFGRGIHNLNELRLTKVLYEQVMVKKKPFLGICLGMQLAAKIGQEYGTVNGLGWFDAEVVPFDFKSNDFKIPHMGWNDVEFVKDAPLFKNLKSPSTFYFVHSYHFVPRNTEIVTAVCDYGGTFVASVSWENIHLVQFHPEKSQSNGLQVLKNFLSV